jgi:methylated-DNA-[protein]-cysteine S-methyltransferase
MTTTLTAPRAAAASPDRSATLLSAEGATPGNTALAATVSTPAGPFTVVAVDTLANDRPTVIASGWTDDLDALLPQVAAALRPAEVRAVAEIRGVTEWVVAYHEGELHGIDSVSVRQDSGPFLELLWDALREVPPGHPVTYTELAARAGRVRAARAAGSACSRNASALFVPCHRVVPAGGGVGGFRWGPDVKRWLLAHEEQNA